jgi:hypothetical protein
VAVVAVQERERERAAQAVLELLSFLMLAHKEAQAVLLHHRADLQSIHSHLQALITLN